MSDEKEDGHVGPEGDRIVLIHRGGKPLVGVCTRPLPAEEEPGRVQDHDKDPSPEAA